MLLVLKCHCLLDPGESSRQSSSFLVLRAPLIFHLDIWTASGSSGLFVQMGYLKATLITCFIPPLCNIPFDSNSKNIFILQTLWSCSVRFIPYWVVSPAASSLHPLILILLNLGELHVYTAQPEKAALFLAFFFLWLSNSILSKMLFTPQEDGNVIHVIIGKGTKTSVSVV